MTKLIATITLAVGLAVACAPAPPAGGVVGDEIVTGALAETADSLLSAAADSGFVGTALLAADGEVVLHAAYGRADSGGTAASTTTPFWIASISKQFAAAAMLLLEERGMLSRQDSLGRFFDGVPAGKRGITLHQLLTHTAGLEQRYAADGITDRGEAVAAILGQPLARPPGEGFGYSNDAYNLVAAVVEVVSGRAYEAFVREELLEPAGLAHTGFWGPTEHPQVTPMRDPPTDPAIVRPNWGFRGATGMFSTAGDLHAWYRALEEGRVLSASSWREMTSPHVLRGELGVGYGWFTSTATGGPRSVWTRGYEDFGHGAVLTVYPEDGLVLVVMSSSGDVGGDPVSHRLARELEDALLSRP